VGTEKLVSRRALRQVLVSLGFFGSKSASPELTDDCCFVCSLFSQLKCAHLVPAKAPLQEEAIFNQNNAATERRRTAHKAQHKEREIATRNRNDTRIKRRKAGERDVSSNEDPSSESTCSSDEPSVAVDWRDMSWSSTPLPPCMVELISSRRIESATREKNVDSSSRSAARPVREDQQATSSRTMPGGPSASEARRDPPHQVDLPIRSEEQVTPSRLLYDGSHHPDSDSLQRRPSRARSSDSASTPSTPREADSGVVPQRLQSLIIWGDGAPDVQVSLIADGSQGPSSATAEVRRIAPE
jgi:hypothetical protein